MFKKFKVITFFALNILSTGCFAMQAEDPSNNVMELVQSIEPIVREALQATTSTGQKELIMKYFGELSETVRRLLAEGLADLNAVQSLIAAFKETLAVVIEGGLTQQDIATCDALVVGAAGDAVRQYYQKHQPRRGEIFTVNVVLPGDEPLMFECEVRPQYTDEQPRQKTTVETSTQAPRIIDAFSYLIDQAMTQLRRAGLEAMLNNPHQTITILHILNEVSAELDILWASLREADVNQTTRDFDAISRRIDGQRKIYEIRLALIGAQGLFTAK